MQRYRCAATLVHRGCNVKTTDNATASGLDHRSTSAVACEPILRAKHAKLAGDLRRLARAPGAAAVAGEKTGAVDRGQLVLGGHCDDPFSMDSDPGVPSTYQRVTFEEREAAREGKANEWVRWSHARIDIRGGTPTDHLPDALAELEERINDQIADALHKLKKSIAQALK
jgi:hypothetical protein